MINPYFNFAGNCAEAIHYYETIFDVQAANTHFYGDYVPLGLTDVPKDLPNWVLHSELVVSQTTISFADEVLEPVSVGTSVKLNLTFPTKAETTKIFDRLKKEAQKITLEPVETYYSDFHGALIDKYGVCWQIISEGLPKNR